MVRVRAVDAVKTMTIITVIIVLSSALPLGVWYASGNKDAHNVTTGVYVSVKTPRGTIITTTGQWVAVADGVYLLPLYENGRVTVMVSLAEKHTEGSFIVNIMSGDRVLKTSQITIKGDKIKICTGGKCKVWNPDAVLDKNMSGGVL